MNTHVQARACAKKARLRLPMHSVHTLHRPQYTRMPHNNNNNVIHSSCAPPPNNNPSPQCSLLDICTAGRAAIIEQLLRSRPKPRHPMREQQETFQRAASLEPHEALGGYGGCGGYDGAQTETTIGNLRGSAFQPVPRGGLQPPSATPGAAVTFVTKDGSCLPSVVHHRLHQASALGGRGGGGGAAGGAMAGGGGAGGSTATGEGGGDGAGGFKVLPGQRWVMAAAKSNDKPMQVCT